VRTRGIMVRGASGLVGCCAAVGETVLRGDRLAQYGATPVPSSALMLGSRTYASLFQCRAHSSGRPCILRRAISSAFTKWQ
jgi:hypothetical protein